MTTWIAAMVLGFTGSLHCMGMCGPIAMMVHGSSGNHIFVNRLVYNFGRVLTYVVMGIAVGVLGKIIQWGNVQGTISVAVGILIILILLIPGIQKFFLPAFTGQVVRLKKLFSGHIASKKTTSSFITGLFNGFLPCGLVYGALAIALIQSSPFESATVMIMFGLGTLPGMLAAAYSWQNIRKFIPWSFQRIQTAMLVVVAVIMIYRGIVLETNHHEPISTSEIICIP